MVCGNFLKYYNKPQVVGKTEDKKSPDEIKFVKDLGFLFLFYGWIYLIIVMIYMIFKNDSIQVVGNLIPYFFVISIILLILYNHKDKNIFKSKKIFLLIGGILLVMTMFSIFDNYISIPNEISVNGTVLSIKGIYGMDVNLKDIDKVDILDEVVIEKNIFGIKTNKSIKGRFQELHLGEITAYLENEHNVVAVFLNDDKILCINFKNKNNTDLFYEVLKSKIENNKK